MKRNKIKYLPLYEYQIQSYIDDGYKEVSNPLINYKNLRDGEYLIRGEEKGINKSYYRLKGRWFENNVDYSYDMISVIYELFPQLPYKEWEALNKIPVQYFNNLWKRHINSYNMYMSFRNTEREAIKNCLSIFKKE